MKARPVFRRPETPVLQLLVETNGGILLKLPRLNREIGLRGMQLLRGNAKSLSLQDREQTSKMAKLGSIVHSSLLDIKER